VVCLNEFHREASIMRGPWLTRGCCSTEDSIYIYPAHKFDIYGACRHIIFYTLRPFQFNIS
jgi:hypothetical protein